MASEWILAIGLVLGALGYVALAAYVWRHRTAAGSRGLLGILVAVFFWTTFYALEVTARSVASAEFWSTLKFIGVDGIVLTNNVVPLQPDRGMHLARLTDSSNAWVMGNVLPGGEGAIFTNDGSRDFCHSGNRVGDPLAVEDSSKPCS